MACGARDATVVRVRVYDTLTGGGRGGRALGKVEQGVAALAGVHQQVVCVGPREAATRVARARWDLHHDAVVVL